MSKSRYAVRVTNDYSVRLILVHQTSLKKTIQFVRDNLFESDLMSDTQFLGIPIQGCGPHASGFAPGLLRAAGFVVDVIQYSQWVIPLVSSSVLIRRSWAVSLIEGEALRAVEIYGAAMPLFWERRLDFAKEVVSYEEHVQKYHLSVPDWINDFPGWNIRKARWYQKRTKELIGGSN